jgi:predicted RNase H-like HicB family nuclease
MNAAYTIVVYEAEEGGYWAKVPELPGCASQGETLDELQRNVKDAILAWLETVQEEGGEAPSRPFATILLPIEDDAIPA